MTELVFASPMPPFPLDNGGRVRMHRLLTGLASEFPTTLVTYEHHPDSGRPSYARDVLADLLPGIEVVTVPGVGPMTAPPSFVDGLAALLAPLPASWRPYHQRRFTRVLVREAQRRAPALVHFDYFAFFPSVPGAFNVRAPHNVESAIAHQDAMHQRGRGRLWHEAEWRKLRRLERRAFRSSQLCLAVSELDARAIAAAGARRVALCPNGTDPVEPCATPTRHRDDPLRILFVGSGDYPPYERGIEWFVREVLPAVRQRVPAVLDVVGRRPVRVATDAGVRYVGPVPALRGWYERAHVVIVPVFEGSGTRLKIIEAMAHGRPVVSTRLGAEGLPVQAATHYLLADDAPAFAAALGDVAEWCRAGDRALLRLLLDARAVSERHFWPDIVHRLGKLYRAELETSRKGSVPVAGPSAHEVAT
jgi:glycosyltransferase involved in cell wall biosynthesis